MYCNCIHFFYYVVFNLVDVMENSWLKSKLAAKKNHVIILFQVEAADILESPTLPDFLDQLIKIISNVITSYHDKF